MTSLKKRIVAATPMICLIIYLSLGYCIDCTFIDYSITEKTDEGERELMRIRSVDDYTNLRFVKGKQLLLKK